MPEQDTLISWPQRCPSARNSTEAETRAIKLQYGHSKEKRIYNIISLWTSWKEDAKGRVSTTAE